MVLAIYAVAGLSILGFMTALWITSLALCNSSIVDIFWGMGFVGAKMTSAFVLWFPRKYSAKRGGRIP